MSIDANSQQGKKSKKQRKEGLVIKRIFALILCCIIAITFVACSKTLSGKYYSDDNKVWLEFRQNGILKCNYNGTEAAGTYEIRGDQVLMNNGYMNFVGSIKGNSLIVETNGETTTLTKKNENNTNAKTNNDVQTTTKTTQSTPDKSIEVSPIPTSNNEPSEESLNDDEKRELNTFLSNFSEVKMKPFKKGQATNYELVNFGIMHNVYNGANKFEIRNYCFPAVQGMAENNNYFCLSKGNVISTVSYFMEAKITKYDVFNEGNWFYQYDDEDINETTGKPYGNYYVLKFLSPYENSKVSVPKNYPFSRATKLVDNKDGTFTATFNIYPNVGAVGGGDKAYGTEAISANSISTGTAILKKISDSGNSRYILIEYTK